MKQKTILQMHSFLMLVVGAVCVCLSPAQLSSPAVSLPAYSYFFFVFLAYVHNNSSLSSQSSVGLETMKNTQKPTNEFCSTAPLKEGSTSYEYANEVILNALDLQRTTQQQTTTTEIMHESTQFSVCVAMK